MRVLRTEMIANSAATNHPLARTSASTASRRMPTSRTGLSIDETSDLILAGSWWLDFSAAEEMRVDELVDGRLILRLDFLELQAHAMSPIAPRNASFGVDVTL